LASNTLAMEHLSEADTFLTCNCS